VARRGLKHRVTGGVAEQVVDFLEPIEVEAEHRETLAPAQGVDFLVDPRVEVAAIGKRRQRVVMREIVDMLLGLLARPQITHGDDVMRPSGKHDRPQDQLDRGHRAVEVAQTGFNRQARVGQQSCARNLVGKTAFESCTDESGTGQTAQSSETCVDGDDRFAIANQKSLYRCIGEIAHPVDLKLRTAPVADIEHGACQRQPDNDEACERHAHCKPSGRQRRLRNLDGWIGNDRHRAHRREVMAADRQRQQQRAADLPFLFLAMKTDRKRHGADGRAEHDRCNDENAIPQDHAGNFKGRHSGVVHGGNAAGNDGAADPRTMAPARGQRHREPHGCQRYRRDQRQQRQQDIISAWDPRREGEHRDEMRRPDAEAGGNGGYRQPHASHLTASFPCMAKQIDRGK
jgi:hypothetical protein